MVSSNRWPSCSAGTPTTGQLNTATENALNSMLAVGNNQMGGNTNTNQMNAKN